MQLQAFELFSGEARVSQAFREAGVRTASYDALYDPVGRSMNFLSPGGFASYTYHPSYSRVVAK